MVKVVAVASFEGVRLGDMAEIEETPRILALIEIGYLKVVEDGSSGSGPGGDSSGELGSSPGRTEDGSPPGDEPGEDPSAS